MAEQQRQHPTYNGKAVLLLAVLIAAGLCGNIFALRLFTGFNYLLGGIAVLLVVAIYGVRWGVLASLIASSWTVHLFGHPYAMIWLTGEALFVGLLLERGRSRNIILYATLYWPLIGGPILWFFFLAVMKVPLLGTVAATLMYWIIGITNALMASLLLNHMPPFSVLWHSQDTRHTIAIHQLIFNLLISIVMIPAIVIMVLHGRDTEGKYLHELDNHLKNSTDAAVYEIRLKLQGQTPPGDLAPQALRDLIASARYKPYHQVTVLDSGKRVVASTRPELKETDVYEPERLATLEPTDRKGVFHLMPVVGGRRVPLWQRSGMSEYLERAPLGRWTVLVEAPYAPYQQKIFVEHIQALTALLVLNLLALCISLYTSRKLAAPIRRLSLFTTDLPDRLLRETIGVWPESKVTEIDQLIGNFRAMATALSQRFHEISYANETLELRVEERTRDLTRANSELQREVAERKQTERQRDHLMDELVNQLRFLQTMIDAIPNPIFYKNADGLYQGCNRAFEENWGFSRENIVGKSVHDMFPPQAAEIFHKADRELFERRGVQIYETQTRFADGQPHAIVFYKATYDDSRGNLGGLVGTVVDITARKQAEAERDRLLLELEQKNKELEGIVYVASHDLRSPLVNVQGFSRKLAKGCADLEEIVSAPGLDEDRRALLESIVRERIPKSLDFITGSIEKMDGLLNGLLRLSRLGRAALCFDTLDMHAILTKIVSSMTYQIETSGARVELGRLAPCIGDGVQVTQVFSNLLDNAVKYRSPERPLVVRVFSEEFPEGVRYCVEDNGMGIPREQQEHVWEIFHRLNPDDSEGEGLGLTLARRILDRLGGSIRMESDPAAGSRFYVELPRPHQAQ